MKRSRFPGRAPEGVRALAAPADNQRLVEIIDGLVQTLIGEGDAECLLHLVPSLAFGSGHRHSEGEGQALGRAHQILILHPDGLEKVRGEGVVACDCLGHVGLGGLHDSHASR
jgi:hypothetical protein